jgi:hypothetical protein
MPQISLAQAAPLRPFKIDVRDKDAIKALFYKLEIRMFGWNLSALFDRYCLNVSAALPTDYHQKALLRLVVILISGDGLALLDDPSALFHEDKIDVQLVSDFISSFVDELKNKVCEPNNFRVRINSRSYRLALFGEMTSILYSKFNMRSPAIPAITGFMLILLANLYALALCATPTADIVRGLMAKANLV